MRASLRAYSALTLLSLATACSNSGSNQGASDGGTDSGVTPATQASLTAPGPYQVGKRDFSFVDTSRSTPSNGTYAGAPDRTLNTTVWFPSSDGTAMASGGPFPIIAYAHGFLSSQGEADALKTHLASHGYIVAAPSFPLSNISAPGGPTFKDLASQPGDLSFIVEQVSWLAGADADLANAVDVTRQGIAGLSLGGATTIIAAFHPALYLPKAQAAVAYAPAAFFFGPALYVHPLPTVIFSGSADLLVPFDGIVSGPQASAPVPTKVVKAIGGTHMGFMGIDSHPADGGNTDDIGCGAVQSAVGANTDPALYQDLIAALTAGADGGAVNSNLQPDICATRYAQTMSGERQLELTKAITLAQFEAVIRGRKDAAAYLDRALDPENDDVEVTRAK